MKAILEFDLPEEEAEHKYALAGTDALLLIEDLCNEIRSKLRHNSGDFHEFLTEEYQVDGSVIRKRISGDDETLDYVWKWIIEQKQERQLPELV